MEKYYFIENISKVDKNEFETGMKEFVKMHSNDFGYFKKRYDDTTNMSDKWRYALICWFYQRHSFYFLEDAIMILLDCTNKCNGKVVL